MFRAGLIFLFFGALFCAFSEKPFLRYAKGFEVRVIDGIKVVTVGQIGEPTQKPHSYVLVPRGTEVSFRLKDAQLIEVPVRSVAGLSQIHASHLIKLGLARRLKAFGSLELLKHSKLRQRISQGKILEAGSDVEKIQRTCFKEGIDLVVDVGTGDPRDRFNSLIQMNIGVIKFRDYLEPHPLGAAEWIKFTALFFNYESLAEDIFSVVEARYNRLKKMTRKCRFRPTVLLNSMYRGRWHLPGRDSFWGQILFDGGGTYIFNRAPGQSVHELGFEKLLDIAGQAKFWVAPEIKNENHLLERDPRHNRFSAYTNRRIYGDLNGQMDFLRNQPDLLLKDLITILHPELFPEEKPVYLREI